MRHLITPVVLLAIALAGVGYVRGWYTLTSTPGAGQKKNVTIVVNQDKWKHDRDAFLKQAGPVLGELEQKLHDLMAKSQQADPAAQPALTQEILDLTKQHEDLKNDVSNLSNASQDHWNANGSQVAQKLDNLKSGFQRTFARIPSGN